MTRIASPSFRREVAAAIAAVLTAASLVACSSGSAARPRETSALRTAAPPPARGPRPAADTIVAKQSPLPTDSASVVGSAVVLLHSSGASSCFERIPRAAFRRVAVYAVAVTHDSSLTPRAKQQLLFGADALLQTVAERARAMLRGANADAVDSLPRGEPLLGDSLHVWRGVGGALELTAYRDGHVTWRVPQSYVGDTSAVALLARALDAARAAGEAGVLWTSDPTTLKPDSAHFEFSLEWPTLDHTGKVDPSPLTRAAEPLFSMLSPWMDPVTMAHSAAPRYPRQELSDRFRGTVIMQFVVDTAGRAEPPTVRDLWPSTMPRLDGRKREAYDGFVAASRDALLRSRFAPARIGGCPVKQIVQQPYQYEIAP